MEKTYWNNNGTHEALYAKLNELVPASGSVVDPKKNRALEKMRKAANCYYDLFNNGLCNRAAEFRSVFGFGGTRIVKNNFAFDPELESKMDAIILAAAEEQNISI